MATDLNTIKSTLINISKGNSILETLMEFERTLDNAEIFAYQNWILGELVEGPDISRYWYKTTWMFPYNMMPDPDGGLRLTKIGAKVNFKKGVFKKPVKVNGPEDWVNPETKQAKLSECDVWLVTIELPIKYINRGIDDVDDVMQRDVQGINDDISSAYEEVGIEDEIDGTEEDLGSESLPPEEMQ